MADGSEGAGVGRGSATLHCLLLCIDPRGAQRYDVMFSSRGGVKASPATKGARAILSSKRTIVQEALARPEAEKWK